MFPTSMRGLNTKGYTLKSDGLSMPPKFSASVLYQEGTDRKSNMCMKTHRTGASVSRHKRYHSNIFEKFEIHLILQDFMQDKTILLRLLRSYMHLERCKQSSNLISNLSNKADRYY